MIPRRFFFCTLLCSLVFAGVASSRQAGAVQSARQTIPVLLPDARDLQLIAFWVALGGGYFAREGLDVRVVASDSPGSVVTSFKAGAAPVAILPGPAYERLVGDHFPLLLVANLLQNDPLELVMRRDASKNFDLNSGSPLRKRLGLLRGAKIGVSVSDRARLYQLFRAAGLDANLATIVVRKGNELLAEFSARALDAIYVPPLYAAKALVERDGVIYIDTAGGEVPEFGERLVQALAVTSDFARARGADVEALVRAIGRAEHAIHFQPNAATEAIARALPDADPKLLARVVATYARAVPATPHLEARLIKREAGFYPVGDDTLDLSGIDLESVVFNGKEYQAASRDGRGPGGSASRAASHGVLVLLTALALAIALLVVLVEQREGRGDRRRGERSGAI